MQQTLLALCAVAVFSIYALNTTRGEAAAELRSVTAGAEDAVASAARQRLAAIDRLAFDEQDVGRGNQAVRLIPTTSAIGRDADEVEPDQFDDVDDFTGLIEERDVQAGAGLGASDGVLRFRLTYTVRYIDPLNPTATSLVPTLAKELAILAEEVKTGQTGRPPITVTLRKVFTPAGMTTFRTRG